MERSCSSMNALNLGSTASMSVCGRLLSSGSRETISFDVAVAHRKGCIVDFTTSDEPANAAGGVASPRDDAAWVALVFLFVVGALCVQSSRYDVAVVTTGPRETIVLALDFPFRGARWARTLSRGGWSMVVAGDCVIDSATTSPWEWADVPTDLNIVGW